MAARKRWSLSVPQDGFTLAEHAALARDAEQWGYEDAWSYESDGLDCFSPLAVIGWPRISASAPPSPTCTRGARHAGPVRGRCRRRRAGPLHPRARLGLPGHHREMERGPLRQARHARAGDGAVPPPGADRRARRFQREDVRGGRLPPHQAPGQARAHLRRRAAPGMLRVAGEVADGVILNWLAPEDVPKSVRWCARRRRRRDAIRISRDHGAHLREPRPRHAGVRAGRAPPRRGYLNVPVYRHCQEWLGRTEALGPMWRAWEAGDRKAAVAAIPRPCSTISSHAGRCPRSAGGSSATSTRASRPPSSPSRPRSRIPSAGRPSSARRCGSSRCSRVAPRTT